jgi:perosamine synthetase
MASNVVTRFEDAFAKWTGADSAFAFWKGRVAMYAILRSLGVSEGDEVILPGYTCVMDVNPIKYLGAEPVFVDIEPDTYNIDVGLIEEKITPKTKVIIAQHTYGYPCEMDAIMDIADKHGIPVVEDCCLALGSKYRDKLCGTFGVAAYFSFQWNKPFTTGIGGMVVASDAKLADKIRDLREAEIVAPSFKTAFLLSMQRLVYRLLIYPKTTAMAQSLFRWLTKKGILVGSSSTAEFVPEMADDFFMAMGSGQARAGLRQLKKIDGNLQHRRTMQRLYDELLVQAGFSVPEIPEHFDPSLVRYPVRVADKQRAIVEAPASRVEIGTWFECPLHPIETPMHLYGYTEGMCPLAEKASREVVNLPTHPRANRGTAVSSVKFVQDIGPVTL